MSERKQFISMIISLGKSLLTSLFQREELFDYFEKRAGIFFGNRPLGYELLSKAGLF
jgi:hypothetical protein